MDYITIIRFCMLSVLLHDVCTICTINCKLCDWYNDITYRSRLCFQTSIVLLWISFFHISVNIAFWVSLQLIALQLNHGCCFSSLRIWPTSEISVCSLESLTWTLVFNLDFDLQHRLWSSTWTLIFNLDQHIYVGSADWSLIYIINF